jgi:hypothetical protein
VGFLSQPTDKLQAVAKPVLLQLSVKYMMAVELDFTLHLIQ